MSIAAKWDHIHLRSADPDQAAAFYQDLFGAARLGRTENGAQLRVTIELAGLQIFIDRAAPDAAPAPETPVSGFDHLALGVTDIDQAVRELTAKGVEIFSGPTEIRPGVRVAFARAPDRIRIELLERQ